MKKHLKFINAYRRCFYFCLNRKLLKSDLKIPLQNSLKRKEIMKEKH
jgi:hypothetical protein